MSDGPYIPVARIVRPHGVRGEVSVTPLLDLDLAQLAETDVWVVPPIHLAAPHSVESVRPGPKGVLVKLSGVDDIDTAREAANHVLSVERASLPEELLVQPFDPLGCVVEDEERGPLGTISEVIVTGANDVWVVQDGDEEVLVPVIDDVVVDVDTAARMIRVRLLPGLMEE
jgi:16S rRNA processing protein RimM